MLICNQIQSLESSKNTEILHLTNYFSNPFFINAHKGERWLLLNPHIIMKCKTTFSLDIYRTLSFYLEKVKVLRKGGRDTVDKAQEGWRDFFPSKRNN
jgi:hypothetical protein